MLHPALILVVLLALFASVIARDGLLFLVSVTALGAAGVSRLSGRYCLVGVEYRRRLSQRRAAWGDEVELEIEVVNRKPLPLAWLEIQEDLPSRLAPDHAVVRRSYRPGRALLTALLSLRWYERVRRRYRIHCFVRGDHRFGPATLRAGDVFGFETRERVVSDEDSLIVYPQVVSLDHLGLPAADPLGERATRDWLFQDPIRTIGVREYVRGDSPRRIHWPATARMGALQVKINEPTIELRLVVCLNIETLGEGWWRGYDPQVLELGISTAASVVSWAVAQGRTVGLYSNATRARVLGSIARPPSRDPDQLAEILTLLARALAIPSVPFRDLIERERRYFPYGATVVIVSAAIGVPLGLELQALRAAGHRVVVLQIGERDETPKLPGVSARRVTTLEALV